MQKRKLTTPFRKLRVLNMFLKLLLSIFNVRESQYRLARQKTKQNKKARKTLENIIENESSKKQQGRKQKIFSSKDTAH